MWLVFTISADCYPFVSGKIGYDWDLMFRYAGDQPQPSGYVQVTQAFDTSNGGGHPTLTVA